jgi:hypothetical protein
MHWTLLAGNASIFEIKVWSTVQTSGCATPIW